jgi:acyl-CoA thioester hydrolase
MNIEENNRTNTSEDSLSLSTERSATFQMTFRVAYHETDGQRRVHHANYLNYFEQSRVEMLRANGLCYRAFENAGLLLVVTEMNVRYRSAAEFDDLLTITTTVTEVRGVRIRHHYVIDRDGEIIVEADSTIACVDRSGKVRRLPKEWGLLFKAATNPDNSDAKPE